MRAEYPGPGQRPAASPSHPGSGLALGLPSRGAAALKWSGEGRRQTSCCSGCGASG